MPELSLSSPLPLMRRWVSWTQVVLIPIPRLLWGKFETRAITKGTIHIWRPHWEGEEGLGYQKKGMEWGRLREFYNRSLPNAYKVEEKVKKMRTSYMGGPKRLLCPPLLANKGSIQGRRRRRRRRPPFALYLHKSLTTDNGGTEPLPWGTGTQPHRI